MKAIAVTGGAQGIGRGIAYAFAKAGYAVSIADPAEDAGSEVEQELRHFGSTAVFVPADVARADEVAKWVSRTVEELGCPDVLVNNAGIMRNKPFLELSSEDFDRVIAVSAARSFARKPSRAK